MTTRIFLVRHGEVDNPNNVNYGSLDGFGLSFLGIKQAEKLAQYFKSIKISQIYSSPLLRTKETAILISEGNIPIKYSKKIKEVGFGKLEGKPIEETLKIRNKKNISNGFPAESYTKVQKRTVGYIKKVTKKNRGESVVIVSHADPIIAARIFFEKEDLNQIGKEFVANASVTILNFNNKLEYTGAEYQNVAGAKKDF